MRETQQVVPVLRRRAPSEHHREIVRRHAPRHLEKDRDALHRARIEHRDEPVIEARQVGIRPLPVNRRMDHRRRTPQLPLDVLRHVPADRHDPRRLRHQLRRVPLRIPARRPERVKLRRMRQVHHPPRRAMMRLPQQPVRQVLRRHQHPVRLELLDVLPQQLNPPRRIVRRHHHDRFVVPQLRRPDAAHDPALVPRMRQMVQPEVAVAARRDTMPWPSAGCASVLRRPHPNASGFDQSRDRKVAVAATRAAPARRRVRCGGRQQDAHRLDGVLLFRKKRARLFVRETLQFP